MNILDLEQLEEMKLPAGTFMVDDTNTIFCTVKLPGFNDNVLVLNFKTFTVLNASWMEFPLSGHTEEIGG